MQLYFPETSTSFVVEWVTCVEKHREHFSRRLSVFRYLSADFDLWFDVFAWQEIKVHIQVRKGLCLGAVFYVCQFMRWSISLRIPWSAV